MHKIFLLLWISLFSMNLSAQSLMKKYAKAEVTLASYSTKQNESGGTLVGDTLYYVRKDERKDNKDSFFNMRRIILDEKGDAVGSTVYDPKKSSRYHDGPLAYSEATGCYFLTRSAYKEARVETNLVQTKRMIEFKIDIYDPATGEITPFPYNSTDYSVTYPALNLTGDTLYFCSDMPGGYGEEDLYRSVYKNGTWGTPENLGENINSNKKEIFPTVGPAQELIFASNRDGGYGGLDIYAAPRSGGHFSSAQLLENPINTEYDDFSLTVARAGNYAFLSSNRAGLDNDDLYKVTLGDLIIELKGYTIDEINNISLAGTEVQIFGSDSVLVETVITDKEGLFTVKLEQGDYYLLASREMYDDVTVPILNLNRELIVNMTGIIELDIIALDADGNKPISDFVIRNLSDGRIWNVNSSNPVVKLSANMENFLRVEAEGYLYQRITESTIGMSYGILEDTVLLYPKESEKVFELANITYDYDSWKLTDEAKVSLDKLVNILKENPDITVDLRSHTDSRGPAKYNMELSKKRAASCKQYLMDQGVSGNRVYSRGFGESRLLNQCADGVTCPELMHQANRRTEIKFDKYLSAGDKQKVIDDAIKASGNRFFVVSGSFKDEYNAGHYYEDMRKSGFNVIKLGKIRTGNYAVALEGFSSLTQANQKMNDVKKAEPKSDVWVYDFGKY